ALSEVSVPGGLPAALAILKDPGTPDRSQFLLEFIRRTYDMPLMSKGDPRETARQSLLMHLEAASRPSAMDTSPAASIPPGTPPAAGADTLPLPLTPAIWTKVVFGGRVAPAALLRAIAGSREASLLYYGLMSLDDGTRAWVASDHPLIAELASRYAAAFAVAAPGLRVSNGAMQLPGGHAAAPAWEALVGVSPADPARFIRAVLGASDRNLPYFLGALAQLTPAQIRFALSLDSADPSARVAAARRLHDVFEMIGWRVEQRTFWRPPLDPALLIADLEMDAEGRPILPGTETFWTEVLGGGDPGQPPEGDPRALVDGGPVDPAWLCARIFMADPLDRRRHYDLVLFASRTVRRVVPENAHDAVITLRAARAYPALTGTLERARIMDLATFAAAARRAALLAAIGDDARRSRAQAQFQGTLSLLTRSVQRGGVSSTALPAAVQSLAAVDLNNRGEYEGRLVRWLDAFVSEAKPSSNVDQAESSRDESADALVEGVAGDLDRAILRLAAGFTAVPPRVLTWEGTRYRVDLATADAVRMARLLGEHHPPYLSSARELLLIADTLAGGALTLESVRRQTEALAAVAQRLGWEDGAAGEPPTLAVPDLYRDVAKPLRRMTRAGDERVAPRLAPALRALADDLLARGVMDAAYAAAMGQPDRSAILAGAAAARHEFSGTPGGVREAGPWQLPIASRGTLPGGRWRVSGSLLGLDLALAEFSLVRLSSKPPSRKPTISDQDQRGMTAVLALAEPAVITEMDREAVVASLRTGRARLAAVRTPDDAHAIAEEIRLAPARRSLLPWVAAHDPERLTAFLSPTELLWLGLENRPVGASLQAWGAPAGRRLGCLCVRLLDRRPWETLAGRWNLGLLASAFPDLNLRLAELLTELRMPASLLVPVLAAATIDFNENATSRDPDDRRGPVEFVQALGVERVEQYLGLLTSGGPLVPIGAAVDNARGDAAPDTTNGGAPR
ncbi:MAG: hypothetical protein M3Q85_15440, partial [Acidobacteriota bacterium]|nr:hypothetical protein [Acidobacteriota bacterium]